LVYFKEYISYNGDLETPSLGEGEIVTKSVTGNRHMPRSKAASGPEDSPNQVRSDSTYNELRELIVSGLLSPGARLVEGEVARRLGVSRTPVRSAFHRLQQEGYAVPASGGNVRTRLVVSPMTSEDAADLFNIVGELEGLSGRYAADLDRVARVRLSDEMTRLNSELLAASQVTQPDATRMFELDVRFHRQLVEAASPPRLLALHDAIKPQVDRYARLYLSSLTAELPLSVAEHSEIVRSLRRGDGDGTQQMIQTNWRNAAYRVGTIIESIGERGVW
jgi:DNA-binding GntR family transcriptional regulator